jgi:hypothetical protein
LQFREADFVWEFVDSDFDPVLNVLRIWIPINSNILEIIDEVFIDGRIEVVELLDDILCVDTRERHVFEEFNLEEISDVSFETILYKHARTLKK